MVTNKNHDTLMGASWNDIEALDDNNPNKRLLGGNAILSDQNK